MIHTHICIYIYMYIYLYTYNGSYIENIEGKETKNRIRVYSQKVSSKNQRTEKRNGHMFLFLVFLGPLRFRSDIFLVSSSPSERRKIFPWKLDASSELATGSDTEFSIGTHKCRRW